MLTDSDILPKTASNLIASAAKAGLIARRRRGSHFQDQLTPLGLALTSPDQVNA